MSARRSSHLDEKGAARMVDVGHKPVTHREAVAEGFVHMSRETLKAILEGSAPKGDVFAAARIASILAAKKTHELIPLCHPLPISAVEIEFTPKKGGIHIVARVRVEAKTGVEMEALTAVAVAALTLYDMCKSLDRGMTLSDIRLVRKTGGASGDFQRKGTARPS